MEFESEYVEPVHLQLSCSGLLSDLPPDVKEITEVHTSALANVDLVLTEFYDAAIAAAARAVPMEEAELRRRFADTFITTMDTRGIAYRSGDLVGSVPAAAVEELERRRLLRAEWRAHARWYELTHDRVIAPVQRSNQTDRERRTRSEARRLRRRSSRLLAALIAVSVAALGLLIYAWNPGAVRKLELRTVDLRFGIRGDRAADPRVVLVEIDEASARALSSHPRRQIADVLDRVIAGAPQVIAADIVFKEQPRELRGDDPALRAAMMRAGRRLVLAFKDFTLASQEEGPAQVRPRLFLSWEDQQTAAVGLGYGGLPQDPGPILRRVDYAVRTEGGPKVGSLASLVATRVPGAAHGDHAPRANRRAWGEQTRDTTWIDYSGGTFAAYSFAAVLDERVAPAVFRNKVVVLGERVRGRDRHRTPFGSDVAGPTIQAEAISTLLRGAPLRDVPLPVDLAVVAAMALAPVAARRLALGLRLAVSAAAAAALLLIAQLAFDAGHILSVIIPLGALLLSLLVTLLVSTQPAFTRRAG